MNRLRNVLTCLVFFLAFCAWIPARAQDLLRQTHDAIQSSIGQNAELSVTASATVPLTANFQWQIVEFFSAKRCDLVREAVSVGQYSRLRPNILAIVAFCEPKNVDPEMLFLEAERKDPSGDLIMVLHAKYVWKKDRQKSKPFWDNVLKHARNEYLKTMASRYLSDEVENDEFLHLSELSYQGKIGLGGGYETNPLLPFAEHSAIRRPQGFSHFSLGAGTQRWLSFGSLSVNYSGDYDRYLETPKISFLQNNLEAPISLRLGSFEDLVFRPFAGYSKAGRKDFEIKYGFGVMGIAYRPNYKQSVEGSVFTNRLKVSEFKPNEGTHFQFKYNWEFFPSKLVYRMQALMEHVRAINDFNNGTNITYSHTDIGGLFGLQLLEKGITYEFEVSSKVRLDSVPSEFTSQLTGAKLRKPRNDIFLSLKPGATFQIGSDFDLHSSYEFRKNHSTFVNGDFANYNFTDHRLELVFVKEFSNY